MRQTPGSQIGHRQGCQGLAEKLVLKVASSAGMSPLPMYRLACSGPLFIPEQPWNTGQASLVLTWTSHSADSAGISASW